MIKKFLRKRSSDRSSKSVALAEETTAKGKNVSAEGIRNRLTLFIFTSVSTDFIDSLSL